MGAGITEQGKRKTLSQTSGEKGVIAVPMSFESNEQGAYRVYFPFAVKITKILSGVVKAIAGSDNGTITGANSTGNSTGGVVTHDASDAIGTRETATPTTNNRVAAGSYYQLTSAKSTAGGKAIVTLEFVKE